MRRSRSKRQGQRLFHVDLNGTRVLTNFDVYQAAGGPRIGVDRVFTASVTDGHLRLNFTSVASSATVSAIQIVGLPAATYNQVRTWQYDPATQRLQTVTMPETGTVTYGYDSKGRLSTKTDGNLIRKEYTYDDKNRVTELHYKKTSDQTEVPNSAVVYSYDTIRTMHRSRNTGWAGSPPCNMLGRMGR